LAIEEGYHKVILINIIIYNFRLRFVHTKMYTPLYKKILDKIDRFIIDQKETKSEGNTQR